MEKILGKMQGFSLAEVMLTTSLIAIAIAGLTSVTVQMTKSRKQDEIKSAIDTLKTDLNVTILDDQAWTQTIAANPNSLGCLNGGDCNNIAQAPDADGYYSFDSLRKRDNTVFFDSSGNNGFSNAAEVCQGYSAGGSDSCPFHVSFDWRPLDCPQNGACSPGRLNIRARFTYSPGPNGFPLNVGRYDVSVIREIAANLNNNNGGGNNGGGGNNNNGNGGGNNNNNANGNGAGNNNNGWWDRWQNRGNNRGGRNRQGR